MRLQILIVAVLSVAVAPAAFAKDLPRMGEQAEEPELGATLEIFDQKKSIKLTCQTYQVEVWAPTADDKGDSTNVDSDALIDANSPLLWDYATSKQRLTKAVLSYQSRKGQPYTIEVPNAAVTHVSVRDVALQINLTAASSRLIVQPRPR